MTIIGIPRYYKFTIMYNIKYDSKYLNNIHLLVITLCLIYIIINYFLSTLLYRRYLQYNINYIRIWDTSTVSNLIAICIMIYLWFKVVM